ncbi:hypothetical protein OEZ86_012811 [Tetradesmus obliquus]|nr:hypothetical protein OEZ86_012811 [Tetradesmus obliquus]
MAWWKTFCEQAGEAWHQLMYSVELACSGADDLPWLDTLNFMWDSLPDADKLTAAERRRLAQSAKQTSSAFASPRLNAA